jgi:hypothetical protein
MNFTKSAHFLTILNKIENNKEKGFATWRALIRRYLFAWIRSSGRQIPIVVDGRDLFSWSSPGWSRVPAWNSGETARHRVPASLQEVLDIGDGTTGFRRMRQARSFGLGL